MTRMQKHVRHTQAAEGQPRKTEHENQGPRNIMTSTHPNSLRRRQDDEAKKRARHNMAMFTGNRLDRGCAAKAKVKVETELGQDQGFYAHRSRF